MGVLALFVCIATSWFAVSRAAAVAETAVRPDSLYVSTNTILCTSPFGSFQPDGVDPHMNIFGGTGVWPIARPENTESAHAQDPITR